MADTMTDAQLQATTAMDAAGGMLVEYAGMRAMVGDDFDQQPLMVTPKIDAYLAEINDDAKTLLILGFLAVAYQLGIEGNGYRQQLAAMGLMK